MSSTPSPNAPATFRDLLDRVARGEWTPSQADAWFRRQQIDELGFATIDLQRRFRRGRPEVVLCQWKEVEHVVAIARRMFESGQNVLLTRVTPEQRTALREAFAGVEMVDDPRAGLMHLLRQPVPRKQGIVAVLAAGTSDLGVAEEAAHTAEALGSPVERAYDVGVAGLHRLLRQGELLLRARVLVVVAGMEGALPAVVSGLVSAPVIAVPTSVGYGANFHGLSALLTMINGCSPGAAVVNIDNGFGAGYMADLINGVGEPPAADPSQNATHGGPSKGRD